MTSPIQERVQRELQKLVGLQLVVARRGADLRGFHFGELRAEAGKTFGDLVLHVTSAWRIDGPDGVVTGRSDVWRPAEPLWGEDFARWDWERDGNLQDHRISEWLGVPYVLGDAVLRDPASRPVVLTARAAPFGGAEIDLSRGYCLTLFTDGIAGGEWRLFRSGDDAPHFVMRGGQIEDEEEDPA